MILDNSFPPDPRVENEAISLIECGHHVFLFCFDYSNNQQKQEIINGITVCRYNVSKVIYKLSALAYTFPFYHIKVAKFIKTFAVKNKIDAFHIHDIQVARSVFWVTKRLDIPIVLDLHENRPEIMKYYSHVNTLIGKILISPKKWKKFEYKYIERADKLIVVTEAAKQYYSHSVPIDEKKIHVVPNTVRKGFYLNPLIKNEIVDLYKNNYSILYLGDTGLRRGLETAISSLPDLINKIPHIKLVIVGQSKTDYLLKNKVKELGVEEYVDFVGWKDFSLFPSYIISSDVGICPIHRNLHHDTTYANKIFQHLAFGKPIVVSNSTAQAELVRKFECGLVFQDRDVQSFTNAIISLFHDRELYHRLSLNGKEAIENSLHWEILSKELIKLYNEI